VLTGAITANSRASLLTKDGASLLAS